MAWDTRDYYREDQAQGERLMGRMSVVMWLLAINVVMWLLDEILTGSTRANLFSPFYWLNFNVEQGLYGLQVWRFFTYQFLHSLDNFLHILFNMMILFALGPMLEQWLGGRRFLAFYLLCGTSGAFVYATLSFVPGLLPSEGYAPLVGASGAIYGIILGCMLLFPDQRMGFLFLPFQFKIRTFAIILLVLAIVKIAAGSMNAEGEAAHLGGALLGFLLAKYSNSLNWVRRLDVSSLQESMQSRRRERQRQAEAAEQAEVDRILDKVRQHGLQSLTNTEKKALQRATDRQRRAG